MVPHCSSDDIDLYIPDTLDFFFANLGRLLEGRTLKNRIDTARQY